MSMSALRRLLSITAIASEARETTPDEAANIAANEQLSVLSPPEIEPADAAGPDVAQGVKPHSR